MIAPMLPPLRVVPHRFTAADLCSGHLALDFVNTAAGLNRDPRDWLDGYPRLVEWAELAGIVDADSGAALLARATGDAAGGNAALDRARRLRAALFALFGHAREGTRPDDATVGELERWCRRAGGAVTLGWQADGTLRTSVDACGLDTIAATVALAAAGLLSSPVGAQLGVCSGHNCGWSFLDPSPSRRRRWCDMRTCGNAAKASRHYRRSRGRSA